mmetsp:Transcript_14796/g.18713  ORF Transcript_14796/g.18713 Transcript_14796/m.18713 type:complete len:433 (+) Transcript_14796:561-1859(+)
MHSESYLLNHIIQEMDISALELNQDLFANGIHFFQQKIPQQHGIRPAVVHSDLMNGILAKRTLLKRRAMWMISDRGEQCPLLSEKNAALSSSNDSQPLIAIKLLTFNRPKSLLRCLLSLRDAAYMGREVPLDIFVDYDTASASYPSATIQICDEFYWPYGSKRIHYRSENRGIIGQWVEAWYPPLDVIHSTHKEFAFFVEDDIEVSPFYYRWLVSAVEAYYLTSSVDTRNLFGISLQEIQLKLSTYPLPFPVDQFPTNQSLLYQLPSTWGVLYTPSHWKTFRIWYELQVRKNQATLNASNKTIEQVWEDPHLYESLAPFIPGNLITNEWNQLSKGKLFLAWLTRFVVERGGYYLYPQLPNRALIINHQEKGIFQGEAAGPNSLMLRYEEEINLSKRPLYSMSPLESLQIVDVCGNPTTRELLKLTQLQVICT